MDQVFAITLGSMHQDMSRLDRIALNLTNAATPGYRREVAAARPFADALTEAAMQGAAPAPGAPVLSTPLLQVLHDSRAGSLKMTGEALDLAITGDAFFEVSTDQGPAYTRRGDLHLDGRGRLATAQGHPVMGRDGEIFLTTRTPIIDADGHVTDPSATSGPGAGGPLAQIKLVRFEHPERLQSLGEGLVAPGEGMAAVGEGEGQLRQGALENSNVSTLQEMVQMIQTTRHFETMQKITQSYDEMMGSAVHKLGDLS